MHSAVGQMPWTIALAPPLSHAAATDHSTIAFGAGDGVRQCKIAQRPKRIQHLLRTKVTDRVPLGSFDCLSYADGHIQGCMLTRKRYSHE